MKLTVSSRTSGKKSETRKLRREGKVPAIVYGARTENKDVFFPIEQLQEAFRKIEAGKLSTTVFELEEGGKSVEVIVKEIQYHPVTYKVLHVDFALLNDNNPIRVNIPLLVTGQAECVGVKLGGFIRQVIRSMKVECMPKDIPSEIVIDVRDLNVGEVKRLGDLPIPIGVKPLVELKEVAVVITKRA